MGVDYLHTRTEEGLIPFNFITSESIALTAQSCIVHYALCILEQAKDLGQLVVLGFDVAVFTPAPYQRPRLGRPSMESSSCGWLRT